MNAKSIIASVSLLLAAGGAFAQGPVEQNEVTADIANAKPVASTVTRAQVKAETIAAIQAGALEQNEVTSDIAYQAAHSGKTPGVEARLAAKSAKDRSVQ
ncbi:DUF4148 domain-containing protein [Duganella sp. BJB488]|uniref:DUF4148 domain-containing protein n=1 Tax=unclassified Duganella TaxID=2636909 RepID=UPI000E345A22|nr:MULTISPECIES: DUF4148 domain-containing protein [unclassified Duganella]NVD71637.1 DUF4148 domain-containing protein [Duganella sp. BJB1802]RFP09078.1 DUF4148 domain-containing protein [Duganella sp. BJB489]RFP12509.1 DUF4148 domain-containing protein [Duganella sp. BJB488]RFP29078.1 DUF4148 domain-containing protein [Duganella sp. BJB480]